MDLWNLNTDLINSKSCFQIQNQVKMLFLTTGGFHINILVFYANKNLKIKQQQKNDEEFKNLIICLPDIYQVSENISFRKWMLKMKESRTR